MTYGIVDEKDDKKDTQKKLANIKANIERTIIYWKENTKRFHKFQKFCFKTGLTTSDESALNEAQKPVLEFNIVNAPLSRQCGEFAKQEPSIEVSARAGKQVPPQLLEAIDGHVRYILEEAKKENVQYNIYRDTMSGGYSNFKLLTEYENEMSMDQVIRLTKTYNQSLVGHDPMAKKVDKSDAEFYFEIFPMDREQFKKQYPKVPIENLDFVKSDGEFNWCFKNQEQYVIIVADYYYKMHTTKKVVRLANYEDMLESEYLEKLEKWNNENHIEQPPEIIDSRESDFVTIERCRVIESQILEEAKTPFKINNIVYTDGDSVILQDTDSANMEQFTKPYIYHAEGLQRLINFTGQVIANDFENMVQHKFMIAEEALPIQETARDAWTNVQQASLLIHRAYSDINPDKPLPIPQAVNRVPLPPEVMQTFTAGMQMLQNILGSYDASLAQNEQQLSGVAIIEAATLSNGAAMPYVINYMQSLSTVANCIVDLLPKLHKNKSPRELPVILKDGTKKNLKVNQEGGIDLDYDSNHVQVKVEAGVNFAIAKNKALQQLTLLMKISPEFAEFMNEVGLETLLDNIEFRNADILRGKVKEWQMKKQQQKQMQPDPEQMKAQAIQQGVQLQQQQLQLKHEEISAKTSIETERLILDKEKINNERIKMLIQAGESKDKVTIAIAKAHAEEERARADLGLKAHHQHHTQFKELAETAIKHNQSMNKKGDK